ncbi:urea carboxylase-associated family protein [Pricia sp. S334]|uniref:Urea carboxylase-associated family protein n=1 Tax=Pricia mediterranea TaxID=3076079 RepID=A0ABU3L9P8_9FLAO|nr:urea carboxylase-associated family protein [Pricia sp. S334]MDT7830434.1 urea carboxylase-associated family protein [Pricia sp. S334]
MTDYVISPRSGVSISLREGQHLKVSCIQDEQVADLVAFNPNQLEEVLSNGKTFDYAETIQLTTGHTLYSNKSNPMLDIIEDTCKTHDFLLAPCCPKTMKIFYNIEESVPTCHGNLYAALKGSGVKQWQIPTAFNIFMNVPVRPDGNLKVLPPTAKAGDYILFEARMDLLIGLTACSAPASNNGSFKPIGYSVW